MSFKRQSKPKKDQLSNQPSTSWSNQVNEKKETESQEESATNLSRQRKQQLQVEYNSDSRTPLEKGLSGDKTSEPLLAREKAALISNSESAAESLLRSQTSGYFSRSSQELVRQSPLNNNEQQGDTHKLSASSSVEAIDSGSVKIVGPSSKQQQQQQQVDGDCYYCNCQLKNNNRSAFRGRSRGSPSLIMSKSSQLTLACFLAELVGTFLLVVIGDGAIATFVVSRRQVDVFTACFAFGVGAMVATFASAKISGAHINPAASLAFALDGKLRWKLVPVYICAQYLGGFLAALVLFVNYSEAINSLDGGVRSSFGSTNSTGQIFATYPASYVSIWGSLLDQIIGTAVLLFSICAVTDKNNAGLEDRHQPLCVAFTIGLICVAFSANCGAIFNPARDLTPRLLTLIFGYSQSFEPIQSLYWLSAGVVGPHIGAIVGVFAYKFLIGKSLIQKQELELEAISVLEEQQQQKKAAQRHSMASKFNQQQQQQQQDNQAVYLNTVDINYGASGQR